LGFARCFSAFASTSTVQPQSAFHLFYWGGAALANLYLAQDVLRPSHILQFRDMLGDGGENEIGRRLTLRLSA
jgi:hypothetical protein